ncbi:unnamed protein product [Pleuronectes platessa]|uniref:USP domain-containing protein n=1 Tax=Pleuronectes platessa TaxID=8262 RepID=A0A9N7TUX8_PLEPL|nr:unnamed protein product [Pleuronectes platessa]
MSYTSMRGGRGEKGAGSSSAEREEKEEKKKRKGCMRKDSPSASKTPTKPPIRKRTLRERLFGKLVGKKSVSKTDDRVPSSIPRVDSTDVPAPETSSAEENEKSDEKKQNDHICKDSPSVAATATEDPIRKIHSDEHLVKKSVETESVLTTDESDMGEKENRLFSSLKKDFQNYMNTSEPSTSQKPNNKFPNPAQICYMNSSLQSLLTLLEFIGDISHQEAAWKMVPEAAVLMAFMRIVRCHQSPDNQKKLNALYSFKKEVARRSPEFSDMGQKDAHEFLMSFLESIEELNPVMTELSNETGIVYKCPVKAHLSFRMQNTRTCRSCGDSSGTEEMFNNLSLNLVPQDSVQDMLDRYLLETDTDYRCACGGTSSTQRYNFKTLPSFLILHVKRFCYTSSMTLRKLQSNINNSRELLVSSQQGTGWYSVVSFISHLGYNATSGHYVSAGVQRDASLDDVTDSWVIYDDNNVTSVKGESVLSHHQKNAYILFYKRRHPAKTVLSGCYSRTDLMEGEDGFPVSFSN